MSEINRGSEWRKWDLHIHTPDTKLNPKGYETSDGTDKWDKFCEKLENSDVAVFGITDYFSVDNYFNFINKFQSKYRNSEKVFFPNIELRLEVGVNKKNEEVNIHIIFSNKVSKEKIQDFLSKLETNKTNNEVVLHCDKLSNSDFESVGIDYKKIKPTLLKVFGKEDCYLIFAAANNQGLRSDTQSPRKINICDEIDKICDGFIGGHQNSEYYLKEDRYELNAEGNKDIAKKCPVISGCDAHSFEDLDNKLGKNYIKKDKNSDTCDSSQITWIKADLTFEGLKQIIYEPQERLFIGENKPSDNLHKISEVTLQFLEDIKIKKRGRDTKEYNFCFSGTNETLYLNDYFNCFIGGRGSGKSSLLNLIYKKIEGQDTQFFKENELINFDISQISTEHSCEKVEFLGQNQVEEFAINYKDFSKAIYERLDNQSDLLKDAQEIRNEIQECDKVIKAILEEKQIILSFNESKKRLDSYNKIIDIIKGPEYLIFQDKIKDKQDQLNQLKTSKKAFEFLKDDFIELYNKYPKNTEIKNDYDTAYNNIINGLETIEKTFSVEEFQTVVEKTTSLETELKNLLFELDEYLRKKGISQEKLNDINDAQEGIQKLLFEMPVQEKQISDLQKISTALSVTIMSLSYRTYEFQIRKGLEIAEGKLNEIKNENVGKIEFKVGVDTEQLRSDLFSEFIIIFSSYKTPLLREDKVRENLFQNVDFETILNNTISRDDFLKAFSGNNLYNDFLRDVFQEEYNFKIYQILIAKYFYNLEKYLKIEILYDGRPIENSSFGQRCTVVILIMLLFGTKPIIIDEPEAHLDSSLIADYLVELIKTRKKERQIIFATHNANFVINADAEQIYILENVDNKTNFIQTSIENLNNREKLLKLEGGEKAFNKRNKKYNF